MGENESMNILILASEYPYEKDTNADRTKVVGYFAKEWVKQGHRVIAIVDSSTFPAAFYAVGDKVKGLVSKTFDVSRTPDRLWTKRFAYDEFGVHVENIPITKYVPHGKFSKEALDKQLKEIVTVLENNRFVPDVVTGHWVNPQIMLVPRIAKRYDAKSAFVFHMDYGKENCEKFGVQKYIDQIDHIGFRSQSAVEAAKGYLHFKEEPFVAASGIPDRFIERLQGKNTKSFENPISIISAGRLVEYKMLDVALAAAAKAFDGSDYDFVVAGDGPMKAKLQNYIDTNNQQKYMHLLGRIDRDELQKRMHESQVFVLISKHETFGLVYLEAMLQGCIVIASKFGGVDGIIRDGENGFLCEEGNEQELIHIFNRINGLTKEEKQKLSQNAVTTAKRFSESDVAKRYLENITGEL